MIEYDQSVVRLGLEKAELEREMERKRKEAHEIYIVVDLARVAFLKDRKELIEEKMKEIDKQSSTLIDYEKRVENEKKKLEDLVLGQKSVMDSIKDKEEELAITQRFLGELDEKKDAFIKTVDALAEDKKQKERERNTTSSLLQNVLQEKNKAVLELYELNVRKSESEQSLEKANRDLAELNEIISILQVTNRQGLDLVASFEGERKRLREKEELLRRKEDDLAVYENRIKKFAEKVGYDIKMIFK